MITKPIVSYLYLTLIAWVLSGACAAETMGPNVETLTASAIGTDGMTVNGRIRPEGSSTTYWFEYGLEANYPKRTKLDRLPPPRVAYYRETWDSNWAGWIGGMGKEDLRHMVSKVDQNGYLRFSEPSVDDPNHNDGIGTLHLPGGVHSAVLSGSDGATLKLGGGEPDLRDAIVEMKVRGKNFKPNGSELIWWTQSDIDLPLQNTTNLWRRANWGYTGYLLTDALETGDWQTVRFQLKNNSNEWSYAGNNLEQRRHTRYAYDSINNAQRNLNTNMVFVLAFVDLDSPPTGSIDFDDLIIRYRNYSIIHPANGGKLIKGPDGSESEWENLTDGWRQGSGKMWKSSENPKIGQELIYKFNHPAIISSIQIHQHTEWPSKDIEIQTSLDGLNWDPLLREDMPEKSPHGPNFSYLSERDIVREAQFFKVYIRTGYHDKHWGLGEIEVFAKDYVMGVEDDWYNVNSDITDLEPGRRYFYRIVAENAVGRTYGQTRQFVTPNTLQPQVLTQDAIRIGRTEAVLTGRLIPMGPATKYHFEYGNDTAFGQRTASAYGGRQVVPRLVLSKIEGLLPGKKYYYRLVATNSEGTTIGNEAVLQTHSN